MFCNHVMAKAIFDVIILTVCFQFAHHEERMVAMDVPSTDPDSDRVNVLPGSGKCSGGKCPGVNVKQ